jgi:hypothetical protein
MDRRELTPEEMRTRRRRSIALALVLGAFAVVFFVTTIVRLGGNIAARSL